MTLTTFPGEPRRTLASQLDRLESILNNLQETLQSVVSAAVEKAVSQAVEQVLPALLTALFTSPQFLHTLQGRTATAMAPGHGAVRKTCQWLGPMSRTAWQRVQTSGRLWLGHLVQHKPWLVATIKRIGCCKRRVWWACGVGLATSFLIYWAGPWLGVTIGFVAGFLLTLAVQDRQRLLSLFSTPIGDD